MRAISSTARSDSSSSSSDDTGDIAEAFTGKNHYQELIDQANTVPLIKVFKHYGIQCNEAHCIIRCPFKSHKGGRENSASFKYYRDTNSFYCFGCHIGGSFAHAPHFIAAMDGIGIAKAASKVLEVFKDFVGDIDEDSLMSPNDLDERLRIMIGFSEAVREFYQTLPNERSRVYVEWMCQSFDKLNLRHSLDNDALKRAVEQSKEFIKFAGRLK